MQIARYLVLCLLPSCAMAACGGEKKPLLVTTTFVFSAGITIEFDEGEPVELTPTSHQFEDLYPGGLAEAAALPGRRADILVDGSLRSTAIVPRAYCPQVCDLSDCSDIGGLLEERSIYSIEDDYSLSSGTVECIGADLTIARSAP